MMMNHPMFVSIWFGIAKAGGVAAFINYSLRSNSLLHCITVSKCSKLIISPDQEIMNAIEEIATELCDMGISIYVAQEYDGTKYKSLLQLSDNESSDEPPIKWRNHVTMQSHFCYMFTSGTTGLPKAAIISHSRAWMAAHAFDLVGISAEDRIYTALPLYHGSASLLGFLGVINTGASMVLRKKFSASNFWSDCREYDVTVVQYIGETLRYVCNQPPKPNDHEHGVRLVFGNGLSPGVWDKFLDRFGRDIVVAEFYTSTEGNIGFYNMLNKKHSVGLLSPFLSAAAGVTIVKYDLTMDAPVLNANGFCIKASADEPGLLIGKISHTAPFQGYLGDKKMTDRKVMRNVFKVGDAYFSSGDIMIRKKDYSVSFVDRIGDTFRWKGENVSTIEVADEMVKAPGISEANVYGVKVPGMEGRAGMMVAVLEPDITSFDGEAVYKHANDSLPSYARPVFIRLQGKMELTGTFKLRKTNLAKEGFDLVKTGKDPIYISSSGDQCYVPLTESVLNSIKDGTMKL